MKATRKRVLALIGAMAMGVAAAAPSVEILSVQQQYPWTNTVDITYEVAGVTNVEYFVRFTPTTSDDKEILDVNGEPSIQEALVSNGTFTAQWYPQTNLQYTACKMTPAIFRGGSGGGRDYLIIDLVNWTYAFEPMATQEESNRRYNTDEYKTKKLVLRRIPADTYYIGEKNNTANIASAPNTYHSVSIPKDYYMAIFFTTVAQWNWVMNGKDTTNSTKVQEAYRDVIRGNALPAATPSTGFFAKIRQKTGLSLDLATEPMWEIAARAGCETIYLWGNTATDAEMRKWGIFGSQLVEVGQKLPNNWGFYDIHGNAWDACRDWANTNNLKDIDAQRKDGLTPWSVQNKDSALLKGGGGNISATEAYLRLSMRWMNGGWKTSGSIRNGAFRATYIMEN